MGKTVTIGERSEASGGNTSGFDYLRLILSVAVILIHSFRVTGNAEPQAFLITRILDLMAILVLPFFFSLSGFLVAASLARTQSLVAFLSLRGLRIIPALAVEVLLSAMVLGPLLTTASHSDYFSNEFYRYFLNVVGKIQYHLPGLFMNNPDRQIVNVSLWTISYEAQCYIGLGMISLIGLIKYPKLFLAGFVAISVVLVVSALFNNTSDQWDGAWAGRQLALFFMGGVVLHQWRGRVPYSLGVALAAAVLIEAIAGRAYYLSFILPLPVAYLTTYLGLLTPRRLAVVSTGDYSYGIYLYAYPIQQSVWFLLPAGRIWFANFAIALIVTGLFAALSWHFVEKPALRLKRFIPRRKQHSAELPHGATVARNDQVIPVPHPQG